MNQDVPRVTKVKRISFKRKLVHIAKEKWPVREKFSRRCEGSLRAIDAHIGDWTMRSLKIPNQKSTSTVRIEDSVNGT